jgi:hypothetical protein
MLFLVSLLAACAGALVAPLRVVRAETSAPEWVADTDTLPGATVYRDADSGLVRSLIANLSFYGVEGTPEDIARLFLSETSDVFGIIADTSDLRFDRVIEGQVLRHIRFTQMYGDVPVWRGTVVVHLTRDQRVRKADSRYVPGLAISRLAPPVVTEEEATSAALAAVFPGRGLPPSDPAVHATAELQIYASDYSSPRYAWLVRLGTEDTLEAWVCLVDAADSSILLAYDARVAAEYTYTGSTEVFIPNPVTTSGDHNLNNNYGQDTAALTAELWDPAPTLYRLDDSGDLSGEWVDAQLYCKICLHWGVGRAHSISEPRDFAYLRGNFHFEEAMAYYHCDAAQNYIQQIWGPGVNARDQDVVVNACDLGQDAYYYSYPDYVVNGEPMDYPIVIGKPATCLDLGEDADVLLHEYNHAMLDSLHNWQYDFNVNMISRAIEEGSGDFFARDLYLQVGEAYMQGWNDWLAAWAWKPIYLRKVTCDASNDSYLDPVVQNPGTVTGAYAAAPFWSDVFWTISKAIGKRESTRLWLEWAGTISDSPNWTDAALALLTADQALNPDEDPSEYEAKNTHLLMTHLKGKAIPGLTDPNLPREDHRYVHVEIEHGDLSKLKVTIGVKRNSGTVRAVHTLADFEELAGSGRRIWVKDIETLTGPTWAVGWWPPTKSDYLWFVSVEESASDKRISDQGVIRAFHGFKGAANYSATHVPAAGDTPAYDAWKPVVQDATTEVRFTTSGPPLPSSYAETRFAHSDSSQVEMLLGVDDLTDGTGVPTWHLRLTKGGLAGWASPAAPRVVRVNLDTLSTRLPPSLARRWHLVARDTVCTEDEDSDLEKDIGGNAGWITDFRVFTGGQSYAGYYQGSVLPSVLVAIPDTQPVCVDLDAGRPETPAAYGYITPASSKQVRVGVPNWTSTTDSTDPFILDITGGAAYLPPKRRDDGPPWDNRWYMRAQNNSTTTAATLSLFALYDHTSPLVYRSASVPVPLPKKQEQPGVGWAYVPYKNSYPTFPDVPLTHWAWMQIEGMTKAGIVGGYDDGTYRPNNAVDRGQIAVFVARAENGTAELDGYTPPTTPTFPDVTPTGEWSWCWKYVEYCYSRGIVTGYPQDGKYHPEYYVDRGSMGVFLARATGGHHQVISLEPGTYTDLNWLNAEECQSVEYLSTRWNDSGGRVVSGYPDGTYRPRTIIDRAQLAVFIARSFAVPQ